ASSFPQPRWFQLPPFGWFHLAVATTFGFGYKDCVHLMNDGVKRYKTWFYTPPDSHGGHNNNIICEGDSGGPGVEGFADERGAIWGVASKAFTDKYGNVVAFRSQIL